MTPNVGTIDRALRALIGLVLIALPFVGNMALFNSTVATIISVAVGVVMLGVAATRFCPLYSVIGLKTCKS